MVTVASLNCPNALVRFARVFCQRKSDVGFSKVQWLPAPASNMPRNMQEFRTRERCEFAQKNRWRMTIENDGTANLLALVSRLQRKILAIIGTRPKGGLPQHAPRRYFKKSDTRAVQTCAGIYTPGHLLSNCFRSLVLAVASQRSRPSP
jgi:hypothetical protein